MRIPCWKKRPVEKPVEAAMEVVRTVGQAVAAGMELEQLLEVVHQQVSRVYDTTYFAVATYNEKGGEWALVYHLEGGQRQPPACYKIETGLIGYIIRNRRPLLLTTLRDFLAFQEKTGGQVVGGTARSWMGVPLIASNRVVGAMAIGNDRQENLYNERDLTFLSTLATQIAIAIEKTRPHQEMRRWAEEMALLQEVNQTLGATLDFHEAMTAVIRGLRRLIPHEGGEICLYDPNRQVFTLQANLGEVAQIASTETYTLEEGYTGWLGRNRKPLLIGNCATFTEVRPKKEEAIASGRLRSYLGVPMLVGDRLIGTIELGSSQPEAFDQGHLRLLTLVAAQAAAAVERARLFEQLSRRLQETRLLLQVSQGIIGTRNLEEVLDMIIRACVEAIPAAEKGSLHILDEKEQELRIRAAVGYSRQTVEAVRLKVGQGFAGRVVQTGEPVIVHDARSNLHTFRTGLPEVEEIRSILAVPLRLRDRVIGVISIDNVHEAGAFDQVDLETLTTFAGQAAIAIENALLYEQFRTQVEQLRHLAEKVLEASTRAQAMFQASAAAVSALEEQSRSIGQFVSQLEQFAEQTDLLALNAAIEAARAGEHGRGFAVVADEVRRLAESSSHAAQEIASLSQQIIAGTRLAAQRMEEARQAVEETTRLAQGYRGGVL